MLEGILALQCFEADFSDFVGAAEERMIVVGVIHW